MRLDASGRIGRGLGLALMGMVAQAGIVGDVRSAVANGDFGSAEKILNADFSVRGNTPDGLLAQSWMARGLLDANHVVQADKQAQSIITRSAPLLRTRKLDAGESLPLALGAAIEVHAQVLAKRGERADAVTFLRSQSLRWKGTSIQARIQKNLNMLTLEGKAAPPLEISQWTGPVKPVTLSSLRGHPVLLFFWAHWCVDCKAEASVVQDVMARYGPAGLKVIGPTMHYGFAGGGEESSPVQELAWIEQTRAKYYSRIGPMFVPVSETTLRVYGVSTTPTLVLIDRQGIVRLYHPGAMSYQQLAGSIAGLL